MQRPFYKEKRAEKSVYKKDERGQSGFFSTKKEGKRKKGAAAERRVHKERGCWGGAVGIFFLKLWRAAYRSTPLQERAEEKFSFP